MISVVFEKPPVVPELSWYSKHIGLLILFYKMHVLHFYTIIPSAPCHSLKGDHPKTKRK